MIRKNSKDLLEWIYEHVTDFTAENDESGLSWESTYEDARSFLASIPRKEKVQKYGIYASRLHFYEVVDFADIEDGIRKGYLSEVVCREIYRGNKKVGRENWNMHDVRAVMYN